MTPLTNYITLVQLKAEYVIHLIIQKPRSFFTITSAISDALHDFVPFGYNSKNVKNSHGEAILLVELQVSACNFTNSITPPWLFFTFFKLYKWYKMTQSISFIVYIVLVHVCVT